MVFVSLRGHVKRVGRGKLGKGKLGPYRKGQSRAKDRELKGSKRPGYRISKSGDLYYESRSNRADKNPKTGL